MSIQSQKIGGIVFREQHYGKGSVSNGNFTTKVYDPEKKEWYVLNTFAPAKREEVFRVKVGGISKNVKKLERLSKIIDDALAIAVTNEEKQNSHADNV